jgi:hypothetical protein
MSSKLAAVLAAAVATAVAVPALTSAQTAARDLQFKERTLTFTEKDSNDFGFVDNPPKTTVGKQGPRRLSIGDALVFRTFLLDDAGTRAGSLDAACTVTGAGNGRLSQVNATCHVTVTVPGGQLFVGVGGKPFARSTTSGAVTGGTGAYAGATGTFHSDGASNAKDTFDILVPVR